MTVGQGFTIFEDAPVADETVASKEAGPRPAVKIGVPDGFTEISKPVRRTTARSSQHDSHDPSPAPPNRHGCTLQRSSLAHHEHGLRHHPHVICEVGLSLQQQSAASTCFWHACAQVTTEGTEKQEDADVKMDGASETDAAQKKSETAIGAKGEETKEADGRQGISIGPTRDGKSLPVKRPPKETRAWEGPTPVRRNRHDRPQPEWAHDSESEVEEDNCRMLTTADIEAAGQGAKGEGTTKGEETKEPATPGEQAAAEKATGKEEAADDPSVFVDVPLSTPTSDDCDEVAKGFMAAEEITAHDEAAALFAPLFGEITAHADDCAAALTFAPHVTDEQRPRTSQLLAAQLLEARPVATTQMASPAQMASSAGSLPQAARTDAIARRTPPAHATAGASPSRATAGANTSTAAPAVTDEKEPFSRTPFSKRPISKTDNVEEPAQKKQTLLTPHVAAMNPGSPGADHPVAAL